MEPRSSESEKKINKRKKNPFNKFAIPVANILAMLFGKMSPFWLFGL